MTRRDFLQLSAGTLCLGALGCHRLPATEPAETAAGIGMLVDLTRCIGCRACVRACNERNQLPPAARSTTAWDGPPEVLAFDQWTVVNAVATTGSDERVPVKRQCMHCLDPACVSVCPVGAMRRLPSGAVIYQGERCVGCRYCVFACPFSVPKFQWNSGMTPVVGKCQWCAQPGAASSGPACAAACPTGALKFGRRDALLMEAHARIHARPDRYFNHIYGEREAGGTAWLYLSHRPFVQLGFDPAIPNERLPSLTRMALQVVPMVVTVLAVTLSALSYVFGRQRDDPTGAADA